MKIDKKTAKELAEKLTAFSDSIEPKEEIDHKKVLSKKKKKQYNKILDALNEIKSGDRNENNGICNNLYFKVHNTDSVENFISAAFDYIYGMEHTYPIEGTRFHHQMNKEKWSTSTVFGRMRHELLNNMIQYCEMCLNNI